MKESIKRFIAILILIIPGLMATYGFLAMKDAFFAQFGSAANHPHVQWLKMILGLVLFVVGLAFIGGWTFYRDRKRNYVAARFKLKRKK